MPPPPPLRTSPDRRAERLDAPADAPRVRPGTTVDRPLDRATPMADVPLGGLLTAMRSPVAAVREAAWAACYERYHTLVWSHALYVMRTVAWLAEPREAAADVASDVFVGLPDAVHRYREEGRAEWWLKQIAVRTALRRRAVLTGRWSAGQRTAGAGDDGAGHAPRERTYVPFQEAADSLVARLDAVDPEELLELERRRAAMRASDDAQHHRWDAFLELYIAGFTFEEIGARMGLTAGTARNWLCNIRKHLGRPAPAAAERPATRGAAHG